MISNARSQVENARVLAQVEPALRSGLEKQYCIHQELFASPNQSQAEYACHLTRGSSAYSHPDDRILHFAGHLPVPFASPTPGSRYATLIAALMRPLSRGSVHITSADALAPPAINPNYFANDVDLDVLTNIVEKALRIWATEPLSAHVKQQLFPTLEAIAGGREGLRAYVRDYCQNVFHPVGTAAMMPREDGGVVDPSLNVYGTSNLRVVSLDLRVQPRLFTHGIPRRVIRLTFLSFPWWVSWGRDIKPTTDICIGTFLPHAVHCLCGWREGAFGSSVFATYPG